MLLLPIALLCRQSISRCRMYWMHRSFVRADELRALALLLVAARKRSCQGWNINVEIKHSADNCNSRTVKLISWQNEASRQPTSTGKSIPSNGCTGHFRFTTKPVLGIRRRLRLHRAAACCNRFGATRDSCRHYSAAAKKQSAIPCGPSLRLR